MSVKTTGSTTFTALRMAEMGIPREVRGHTRELQKLNWNL